MATISTGNFLALADNVGKSLVDLEANFITNAGANAPTISTITSGQNGGSNSLYARVAALNDIVQVRDLAGSAKVAADNVVAWMGISKNALYLQYVQFMNALETHTGGVAAFITTNTLLVHPEFAAAFNYFASNAVGLALRGSAPTAIPTTDIFVPTSQTLASIAVTGSAAGTFGAGTAIDLTKYAPLPLYLKNTGGSPTTGTATSFTITYTNAAGTPGQSATQALSGALSAGATLAISGATGSAVSNIVVNSGGANGDAIAVVVVPSRVVAY